MTKLEKRCEDCANCTKKNGVLCCSDLWDRPCNDIQADECPEEIEVEEVEEMEQKAKSVKIDHQASAVDKTEKKERKPVVRVASDEKQEIFSNLHKFLTENYENVEIVKENKLILVKIAQKTFKIDLIEQRPPKK